MQLEDDIEARAGSCDNKGGWSPAESTLPGPSVADSEDASLPTPPGESTHASHDMLLSPLMSLSPFTSLIMELIAENISVASWWCEASHPSQKLQVPKHIFP